MIGFDCRRPAYRLQAPASTLGRAGGGRPRIARRRRSSVTKAKPARRAADISAGPIACVRRTKDRYALLDECRPLRQRGQRQGREPPGMGMAGNCDSKPTGCGRSGEGRRQGSTAASPASYAMYRIRYCSVRTHRARAQSSGLQWRFFVSCRSTGIRSRRAKCYRYRYAQHVRSEMFCMMCHRAGRFAATVADAARFHDRRTLPC